MCICENEKKIGLYIHVPFCKSKCYYCDFNSFAGSDSYIDDYFEALKMELHLYADVLKNINIESVFIGGGTPSYVETKYVNDIISIVNQSLNIIPEAEVSIETNPGTLSFEKLSAYKSIGINRISMGLQAWQDDLLCSIGRIHNNKEFQVNFGEARRAGFNNINVDLIFGLPEQTIKQWEETIDNIISMNPEHISCYSLKIEQGTRFGDMKETGKLKALEDEIDREMYYLAIEKLGKAGYKHYEISNFAKKGYECKHNLIYWKAREYIGAGAGAHSYYNGYRYNNAYNIKDYIKQIGTGNLQRENSEYINKEGSMSEYVILGLRLTEGIDVEEFKAGFSEDVLNLYHDAILKCEKKKLIILDKGRLKLTGKGLDLANYVMSEFL